MLRQRTRRRCAGFTVLEVLAVTGIISGLQSQGQWRYAITKANEIRGLTHLRQIHQLLMIQSMTGRLPSAALYPKGDPKTDPKSILRLIPGATPGLFVSPFAPQALKATGLTYCWNTAANGKPMYAVPGNTWLLIDAAAFVADPKFPKPTRYLVLYANGKAQAVGTIPPDIAKAVAAARQKLKGEEKPAKPPAKTPAPAAKTPPARRRPRREEEGFD